MSGWDKAVPTLGELATRPPPAQPFDMDKVIEARAEKVADMLHVKTRRSLTLDPLNQVRRPRVAKIRPATVIRPTKREISTSRAALVVFSVDPLFHLGRTGGNNTSVAPV